MSILNPTPLSVELGSFCTDMGTCGPTPPGQPLFNDLALNGIGYTASNGPGAAKPAHDNGIVSLVVGAKPTSLIR